MLATKAALASGGITHCCLRCGLRMFFLRPPDRVVAGALDNVQFDDLLLEQAQAPTGETLRGRREGQCDQFCFCYAVENPRPGGIGIVFAPQHRLEPLLDQLASGPLDSGNAGVQRRGNPAVAPAFAEFRYVRLQQDAGLRQQPLRINSSSWARSSALNRTTYFLTAISFPTTNHPHRCLAATEIQKLPSFSMTGATRPHERTVQAAPALSCRSATYLSASRSSQIRDGQPCGARNVGGAGGRTGLPEVIE